MWSKPKMSSLYTGSVKCIPGMDDNPWQCPILYHIQSCGFWPPIPYPNNSQGQLVMSQKVAPPTPATAHPAAAHHLKLDARRLRLSPREKQGWERPLGMIGALWYTSTWWLTHICFFYLWFLIKFLYPLLPQIAQGWGGFDGGIWNSPNQNPSFYTPWLFNLT